LQILAASPVVNTVFMVEYAPYSELMGSVAPPSAARLGVPKAIRRTPLDIPDRPALHGNHPEGQAPEKTAKALNDA
jgi:hypothetical protein